MKLRSAILLALCGHAAAQQPPIAIYGIEVGAAINAPECQKTTLGNSVSYAPSTPSPCMRGASATAGPGDFSNGGFMAFPWGDAPKYAATNMVGISATAGIVGVVRVSTTGYRVQDLMLADLTAKYGRPTSSKTVPFQNAMGARYDGIAASWDLGPYQIEFLGMTTATDAGSLLVGTKAGLAERQRRIDGALKSMGRPL